MATLLVAALLGLGATWAAARGSRLLARGLGHADHPSASLWLVRGIRGAVVGAALAAGFLSGQAWLLVFGGVFLAEELYETGVVALALRLAPDPPADAR